MTATATATLSGNATPLRPLWPAPLSEAVPKKKKKKKLKRKTLLIRFRVVGESRFSVSSLHLLASISVAIVTVVVAAALGLSFFC